jgi:arylformamidase
MRFTAEENAACSPLRHPPAGPLPAVVALAEAETPGFHRQSAAYAQGLGVPVLTVEGRNHFDVVLDWTDLDTPLSRALLGLF